MRISASLSGGTFWVLVVSFAWLISEPSCTAAFAADGFNSVDEALAVYEATNGAKEAEAGKKRVQAELWLSKQGPAIAPKLSSVLLDTKSPISIRMACCRLLGKLGATARPALEQTIEKDSGPIRLRAIETLGRLTPPEEASVKLLQKLMFDADLETKKAAIAGIANQGKAASAAAPALQKMLNDPKEDEAVRTLAKKALKSVDPRKGLMDVK